MSAPWVRLRELVEGKTGTVNPGAWPGDPFTYVDIAAVDNQCKSITGARHLMGSEAPSRARRLVRSGDVLVSMVRPNLNAVAMVPDSLDGEVASTAFCVLRATPRALPEYLYFFVRSRLFVDRLCKLARGALYPSVTESMILDQALPLPDVDEQRRVVDLLSCAQSAIRIRGNIQANALKMVPALFFEVFGDSMTNPHGWPEVPLGSLLKSGPQNGLYKHKSAYGEGTPIVRIDAFYDGRLLELDSLKRLRLSEDELQRYALAEGDILINRVNSPEYLGKSAIIPALAEPMVFESNMMRLTVDTDQVEPQFVIAALQTNRTRRHFHVNARRAINQASLNQQDIKSLPVMLPPKDKQAAFSRYAETAAAAIVRQKDLQKLAEVTLETLLARVFCETPKRLWRSTGPVAA